VTDTSVINCACKLQENLITQHTASVGILLQSSPLDPAKTEQHEVPLQASAATQIVPIVDSPAFQICVMAAFHKFSAHLHSVPAHDDVLPSPLTSICCYRCHMVAVCGSRSQSMAGSAAACGCLLPPCHAVAAAAGGRPASPCR
jgi:hypothetical protein